jgi:hypothetical protein
MWIHLLQDYSASCREKLLNHWIIGLCPLSQIPQSFAADVMISPSNKIVNQGQTFDLDIYLDPIGVPVAGAQLNIAFNKSLLKINAIKEGNIFKQKASNTFFNGGTINNSSGKVANIFDAILGPANVSTVDKIIIINVTAIGSPGSSDILLFNVKISDQGGKEVHVNLINGTININRLPTTTPSPTPSPNPTPVPTLTPINITGYAPVSLTVNDNIGSTRLFKITVNQTVIVNWYINGTRVQSNGSVSNAIYTNSSAIPVTWKVNATATNTNGTVSKEWTWIISSLTPAASGQCLGTYYYTRCKCNFRKQFCNDHSYFQ